MNELEAQQLQAYLQDTLKGYISVMTVKIARVLHDTALMSENMATSIKFIGSNY